MLFYTYRIVVLDVRLESHVRRDVGQNTKIDFQRCFFFTLPH